MQGNIGLMTWKVELTATPLKPIEPLINSRATPPIPKCSHIMSSMIRSFRFWANTYGTPTRTLTEDAPECDSRY